MKEMKEQRLCYYCDAKWNLGKIFQSLKLYLLEEVLLEKKGNLKQEVVLAEKEKVGQVDLNATQVNPKIFLHALIGYHNPKTMRIKGKIGPHW